MLAMFWRPKGENGFPKYVKICHHLLGYALIALTIANIFQGINNRAHAAKWKWTYVGILCVLGVTALGLEIFKWIKRAMMREAVKLNSNMYTSPWTPYPLSNLFFFSYNCFIFCSSMWLVRDTLNSHTYNKNLIIVFRFCYQLRWWIQTWDIVRLLLR